MIVYLDTNGELTCGPVSETDTVADLAVAVEEFCRLRLDCGNCLNTCCAGLIVHADSVFVNSLDRLVRQADGEYWLPRTLGRDERTGKWFLPPKEDGCCRYLSARGRCLIYRFRPLVCRLHTCFPAAEEYGRLKEDIYFVYQEVLKERMTGKPTGVHPLPAMNDYRTGLRVIREWAALRRTGQEAFAISGGL